MTPADESAPDHANQSSTHANSFGAAADDYNQARPGYPAQAVEWLLAPLTPGRRRVVDIGAGTGIMSRALLGAADEVIAVEPDPRMRATLEATSPGVRAHAGRAEALPLPDASVDAGVAAQAYHWFDLERAHAELARVIRSGGVFAAVWNFRDDSTAWVAEFTDIIQGHSRGEDAALDPAEKQFGADFEPSEQASFRHETTMTEDRLVALLASRSYYLTATPADQARLTAAIRELARTHPDLAGRAEFPLPYVTIVHRAKRR